MISEIDQTVGARVVSARCGYGSFLGFNMAFFEGDASPEPGTKGRSDFYLWLYFCSWTIYHRGSALADWEYANDEDDGPIFDKLVGKRLLSIKRGEALHSFIIEFEGDYTIAIDQYVEEFEDGPEDLFMLFCDRDGWVVAYNSETGWSREELDG